LRIDIRGPLAPTPAASRLFIQDDAASRAAVLNVVRAALRHAIELVGSRVTDGGWRAWLSEVVESFADLVHPHSPALDEELAILDKRFPLTYLCNGESRLLYKSEIIERFGALVDRRFLGHDIESGPDCLDPLTRSIASLHLKEEEYVVDLTRPRRS